MASSSGGGPASLLAVGVIAFAAWKYAQAGGLGPRIAASLGPRPPNTAPTPVASGTSPGPVPAAPAGLTLAQQYNELHDDGWYQVNQWSDGSYTFTYIPPEQYSNYGIDPASFTPPLAAAAPAIGGAGNTVGNIISNLIGSLFGGSGNTGAPQGQAGQPY